MKLFRTILILIASIVAASGLVTACRKTGTRKPLNWVSLQIPEGFPAPAQNFANNPFSSEGIELGRKLFYDGRLSKDGNFPCASCHQQIAAFGTFEHDRSHGYNNSHTLRNAPVLFNLAWQDKFHWDGAYTTLYDEAVQPVTDPIEMAENFTDVISKLRQDPEYRKMFSQVFGTITIQQEHIQKALEQFTGSMVSASSRYDRYKKGQVSFTEDELAGYALFQQHCTGCHPEPLFTDYSYRNIGLPVDPFLNDYGRMRVTGSSADSLKFKVPTLRNVDISSNYMHDGRFNTLAQCINHYRTGIQPSATLDPALAGGIQLNAGETNQMIRFLRTLTDSAFITNPDLSRP